MPNARNPGVIGHEKTDCVAFPYLIVNKVTRTDTKKFEKVAEGIMILKSLLVID
jgi:hypothetical protein